MRKLESQSISKLLKKQGFIPDAVMDKVQKLSEINKLLQKNLPVNLIGHCRVVNFRNRTLVVSVDTPAWKSSLRFHVPALLRDLERTMPSSIQDIEVIVEPAHQDKNPNRRRPASISPKSADLIHSMAESVADPQLKQALLRLSGRK